MELGKGLSGREKYLCKGPEMGSMCCYRETMGKPLNSEHRELRRVGER